MKKSIAAFLLIAAVTANSADVFAEDLTEQSIASEDIAQEADTALDFLTILQIPKKENAIKLTLEEATQKALSRSTALKTSNMDLKISAEKLEDEENSIAGGHTFEQLLAYIKQNASYTTSKLSQQVTEEAVKFSLKQVYIEIINKEREIALTKMSLQLDEKELLIARTKQKLGLISEQELQNQELSYQKALASVEQEEIAVQNAYRSLAELIGMDVDENYQLTLEPVYEPLTLSVTLDTYITSKINTDPNIKQQQINLDTATSEAKFTHASVPESATADQEADNSVAKAELTLSDQKSSLRTQLQNCYDSIVQLESSYNNNLTELENLKKQLTISQKQYELEQCTELEVLQAKQSVAQKESEIIGQMYEHMLLLEQFEYSYLL